METVVAACQGPAGDCPCSAMAFLALGGGQDGASTITVLSVPFASP